MLRTAWLASAVVMVRGPIITSKCLVLCRRCEGLYETRVEPHWPYCSQNSWCSIWDVACSIIQISNIIPGARKEVEKHIWVLCIIRDWGCQNLWRAMVGTANLIDGAFVRHLWLGTITNWSNIIRSFCLIILRWGRFSRKTCGPYLLPLLMIARHRSDCTFELLKLAW
ncbi:hypothetical protein FOVG_08802 [Fusarium oxysporum f. sp. pisi HDV247]|uniref:Secreted protein n=1 Tax=Fusarium oxysporum f. sp. pisi HDV247 TaxID=1080344 RepID=W9PFX9_FUSOX|nr:hypothetical protein FOVG_08802 [Fusarium oxysporum f. sp. pisi HDV247]